MHGSRGFNPDRDDQPTGWRRFLPMGDNPLNWAFPVGRVSGILVRIHIVFLVMILFDLIEAAVSSGGPSLKYVAMNLGCLFVSVLLHEFGHCFACRFVRGDADDILMWPLGGLASCAPPHRWQAHFITTIGGPMVNVILMAVFGLGVLAVGGGTESIVFNPFKPYEAQVAFQGAIAGGASWLVDLQTILFWMYYTNFVLLAFNVLLPMFPMDGGRILQALLWWRTDYRRSMLAACTVGLVAAIFVGVFAMSRGNDAKSSSTLLMIALLGGLTCWQERKRVKFMDTAEDAHESAFAASFETDRDEEARKARQRKEREAAELEAQTHQQELDRILDKISKKGMSALTRSEKKFLEQDTTRRRQAR